MILAFDYSNAASWIIIIALVAAVWLLFRPVFASNKPRAERSSGVHVQVEGPGGCAIFVTVAVLAFLGALLLFVELFGRG